MKDRSQSSSTPKKLSDEKTKQPTADVWTFQAVLRELKNAPALSTPTLHRIAKNVGKNHSLALALWNSGHRSARILAPLIAEPAQTTPAEMDRWALTFDSWYVVDASCCYFFAHSKHAWSMARAWSAREEEYIKRAGFALAAYLSYKDKESAHAKFLSFLPVIERECQDSRNPVKKAVNWALRNIGKRNLPLNRAAIASAKRIAKKDSAAARWIASDALRELQCASVHLRLRRKKD